MTRSILFVMLFFFSWASFAQKKKKQVKINEKSPTTLFTIQDQVVKTDEFIYLYRKNHASDTDFTSEKIQEYFDLYVNFKLKVNEAINRGMDTTTAFKKEYSSYKEELRKPYLPDNKMIDSLVRLTYEHLKFEVAAAHLLILLKENPTPQDTAAAYAKCMELKKRVLAGEDFGLLAQQHSEDPSARENKGTLGYFTALQMVYPFESAAYQAKVGEVVGPVRTQFGYHLIKVVDKRPSSGEVEVSHIMLRVSGGQQEDAVKDQIFKIHEQAIEGVAWDELCKQFSEDQGSKDNGGLIRPFGIRGMASVPEFEEVAFALKNIGDISDPFKTLYGWHIIRLENKIPLPVFESLQTSLRNKVSRDQRVQISRQQLFNTLKKKYHFNENEKNKATAIQVVKEDGMTAAIENEILFTLDGNNYLLKDFVQYAKKNNSSANATGDLMYEAFVQACIMLLEEKRILAAYPEYAMLLKEYYEGILLFEIMEKEIWNKAVEDSVGLEDYFAKHADRYTAGERAEITLYSSQKANFIADFEPFMLLEDSIQIADYISANQVRVERGRFEKNDRPILAGIDWSVGVHSAENNGMYYLAKIFEILPSGPLTFEEAKVSVLTDYQEYLEKRWIEDLKLKYPIKIDEKGKKYVFEQLQK